MQRIFLVIVAFVVGILLITGVLVDQVTDAATDTYAENFNVSTGAGVTNTTETLSGPSYYDDTTGLSATSDNENDTPVVMSYDEDTYDVVVDGLEASASRILTINYMREAHQEFTGFSAFLRMSPFILLVGLFVGGIWALFSLVRNR